MPRPPSVDPLRLGAFFALTPLDDDAGWHNLGSFVQDAGAVARCRSQRVDAFAHARGLPGSDVDARALGAVLHLGWCSRLVSPWVGAALIAGDMRVPTLDELWWQDDGTTTFPLAAGPGQLSHRMIGAPADVGDATFADDLVERILGPLARCSLTTSPAIAWGNAASALNGSLRAVVRAYPQLSHRARELGVVCLSAIDRVGVPSAGTSTGVITQESFRRRTCCQLYRVPGVGRENVCGDCVLRERNPAHHG